MRFDLVVFDLDGTLIDSRGDIADAVNRVLGELGLSGHSDDEIEKWVGEGARELLVRAIGGREVDVAMDEVVRRYVAEYERQRTFRTTVYEGVREGLARLAGAKRFIATNKPGDLARAIVGELGLMGLVDGVLGVGDVAGRKPDPAMLEEAMRRAGASRDRTLYVGDTPVDVHTAKNAGVPLCMVAWGFRKRERLDEEPAYRAGTFDEIVEIVEGKRGG